MRRNHGILRHGRRAYRGLQRLLRDESGAVGTTEMLLLGTVVALGLLVGLAEYRNALVQEYGDLAGALLNIDQSYSYEIDGVIHAFNDTPAGVNGGGVTVSSAGASEQ